MCSRRYCHAYKRAGNEKIDQPTFAVIVELINDNRPFFVPIIGEVLNSLQHTPNCSTLRQFYDLTPLIQYGDSAGVYFFRYRGSGLVAGLELGLFTQVGKE